MSIVRTPVGYCYHPENQSRDQHNDGDSEYRINLEEVTDGTYQSPDHQAKRRSEQDETTDTYEEPNEHKSHCCLVGRILNAHKF